MDARSSHRIPRTRLILTAMIATSALLFKTPAFAADKERIPDVSAPTTAPVASAATAKMVGREVCATCHAETSEAFDKTFHGRKSLSNPKLANACESCHGAGSEHVDGGGDAAKITNPKKLDAAASAAVCLSCHKDKALMMWKTGAHANNNLSCLACHSVHEGEGRHSLVKGKTETCLKCHTKQKVDMRLASHHPVPEGKMTCVSCHNPHGGIEGNLKADSVEEQCGKCHSDKLGPFANEHPPVADGCGNCHAPHGSSNERLLKQPIQMLCISCHRSAHGGSGPTSTQASTFKRERCTDCHKDIHGSDRSPFFAQ